MNALLEYKDFYGSSTKDLNLTAIYVKKLWCHKMFDWFFVDIYQIYSKYIISFHCLDADIKRTVKYRGIHNLTLVVDQNVC